VGDIVAPPLPEKRIHSAYSARSAVRVAWISERALVVRSTAIITESFSGQGHQCVTDVAEHGDELREDMWHQVPDDPRIAAPL
jgi:hypothetical protein